VAILDADKEGFLRSETSLIQTIGRAARNVNAKVILYADKVTDSMQGAMEETKRRRELQMAYNEKHGITPETIKKNIKAGIESVVAAHKQVQAAVGRGTSEAQYVTDEFLSELEKEMLTAAESLEFERAAAIRDRITQLQEQVGQKLEDVDVKGYEPKGRRGKRKGNKNASRIPRPKKRT